MGQLTSHIIDVFFRRTAGKVLLVLCFFLLLSGCTTRFAYNNADWLIHWYVSDYIDLNKQQRQQFDHSFARLMAWHREEELPKYSSWLKSIENQLQDKSLDEQTLTRHIQQANEQIFIFTRRIIDKAGPELVALAATLTDQQKKQLIKALQKQNDQTAKRFAKLKTLSAQRKEYRKNFQEELRERFGKLTSEQLRQLDQWQQQITPAYNQQLEARKEWNRRLSQALNSREYPLLSLFSPERPWQSSEFKELIVYNRNLSEEFVAYMLSSQTPKQHKKLMKELSKLIRTIESLQSK